MIDHGTPLTREPLPDTASEIRGELIDVSGFSLRDLNELDKSVLAEELRRLFDDAGDEGSAVGGWTSKI